MHPSAPSQRGESAFQLAWFVKYLYNLEFAPIVELSSNYPGPVDGIVISSGRSGFKGSRRLSTRNTEPAGFRARRMLPQNSSNRPAGPWDRQNETNTRSNPVGGVHEKMSALQYSTFPVCSRSRLIESISGAASIARTRELRAARRRVQRPVPQASSSTSFPSITGSSTRSSVAISRNHSMRC